jgi:hypothetical protein
MRWSEKRPLLEVILLFETIVRFPMRSRSRRREIIPGWSDAWDAGLIVSGRPFLGRESQISLRWSHDDVILLWCIRVILNIFFCAWRTPGVRPMCAPCAPHVRQAWRRWLSALQLGVLRLAGGVAEWVLRYSGDGAPFEGVTCLPNKSP